MTWPAGESQLEWYVGGWVVLVVEEVWNENKLHAQLNTLNHAKLTWPSGFAAAPPPSPPMTGGAAVRWSWAGGRA